MHDKAKPVIKYKCDKFHKTFSQEFNKIRHQKDYCSLRNNKKSPLVEQIEADSISGVI
jgi:hypothetical protein